MRSLVGILVVALVGACTGEPAFQLTPAPRTASPPGPTGTAGLPANPSAPPSSTATTPAATAVTAPPTASAGTPQPSEVVEHAYVLVEYDVPSGSHPHDVAPAPDGSVWYTGQHNGTLGRFDPATGDVTEIPLGDGSSPHGVIVGPDGAAWITDSGLNAIVRVFPVTTKVSPDTTNVTTYRLPTPNANLNTAAFDGDGNLWFTGQNGVYGRVTVETGEVEVFDAPEGPGPYGIDSTPAGDVWFVSLAGSYLARIDTTTGAAEVFEPPTPDQGARRVWSDSSGRLWVSAWNTGQLSMFDPSSGEWREWLLPGPNPQAYAVFVDELDFVWVAEWGSNSIVRFDPETEEFEAFVVPTADSTVRQLLGGDGEVWGAESGTDKLVVLRRLGEDTIIN